MWGKVAGWAGQKWAKEGPDDRYWAKEGQKPINYLCQVEQVTQGLIINCKTKAGLKKLIAHPA